MYIQKPIEITLINEENSNILDAIRKQFLPESIYITIQNNEQLYNLEQFPFFQGKKFEDATSVYVCRDFKCSLPLHTIAEVDAQLDSS